MKLNINVEGNDKIVKAIKDFAANNIEDLEDEVQVFADNVQLKSAQRVRRNFGILANSQYKSVNGLNAEVGFTANYAAYVEFGTGGMVDVPSGLEEYAIQFKGAGIKQVNLPARPFLFNSAFEEFTEMTNRLNGTK